MTPTAFQKRAWVVLPVLGMLLLISIVLSAGIGSVSLHPMDIVYAIMERCGAHVHVAERVSNIIWELRLPRIALAVLVGCRSLLLAR